MYILIGIAVLIADFASKMIVDSNMRIGEKIELIEGVFSLTYIRNKGMAWGLLQNQRWIFIIGTVVIVTLMILYYVKNKDIHFTGKLGLMLSVAGALGNLIDRLFYKDGVIDFLSADFIDFPIFNVADMSVCIGMGILIIYILFFEQNKKES
ncbi:MAG: signal peptidase II [Ruminococcaceae bacterium]|nr:signal peptidase II [Oscillospiraceae bacterium]